MSDRGFLHDVRLNGGSAEIVRLEEEDGVIDGDGTDGDQIIRTTATEIPNFEPGVTGSWYFETDPDLPTWLGDWADPIITASKNTDDYREHAADWLGEGD